MRAFSYTAYTGEGHRKSGTVVADTEADAAAQLAEKGLYVSEMTSRAMRGAGGGLSRLTARRTRLNADLQAVFTRQMAVLLSAELSAEAALEAVRAGGHPALDAVAAEARAALLEGAALSEALSDTGAGFPPYYIAALRAGETAGDPAGVFAELADHLETLGTDKAQIATALVYPAFVAAVSLLVCGILMVSVAPQIVAMFDMAGRPLPVLTRRVLAVSDFVIDHRIALSAVAGAVVLLGFASGRVPALKALRDRAVLRLPLAGRLMRLSASVQYMRTLALVLSARHTVPNAVDTATGVLEVARFRREGEAVAEAVRQGETLSTALERLSVIPPVARQLIRAGEASARLARMTERAAVLVENGLSTERKRIAALLEPALMMLVGAFVLVVVLSVLLPIFDLQAVVAG
ncbi:general secretion pathway protein GspF [Oceanicola sp. 22II-s10i]|uniref:type II secretion system F family protein n=1 Tax=Oceanicola sp. 22II-s10i TaxID=1317116 RepID=UPI000B757A70|nr:type II secretion system F family protein [Oceanicola sp. 22II-s10i]OWU81678.1 general secretion pathway protein GspF [Oceanicola sp. 22II-s10i]